MTVEPVWRFCGLRRCRLLPLAVDGDLVIEAGQPEQGARNARRDDASFGGDRLLIDQPFVIDVASSSAERRRGHPLELEKLAGAPRQEEQPDQKEYRAHRRHRP